MNDFKFKHSVLALLKIFFERGNKLKSSIASMGNVFRNSKWADLSVQNIKVSFIKSTASLYLLLASALVFFICFYDIRVTLMVTDFITNFLPFGAEITLLIFDFKSLFSGLTDRALLLVYTMAVAVLSLLDNLLTYVLDRLWPSESHTVSNNSASKGSALGWLKGQKLKRNDPQYKYLTKLAKASRSRTSSYAQNTKWSGQSETLRLLYKSQQSLNGLVKPFPTLNNSPSQPKTLTFKYLVSSSLSSSSDLDSPVTHGRLSSLNLPYVAANSAADWSSLPSAMRYNWSSVEKAYTVDTSVSYLNEFAGIAPDTSATNLGILSSLNLAKQDRWLMKNSLLANKLDRHNNAFSQTKSLLGNNLNSSNFAATNIWVSSKLSTVDPVSSEKFVSGVSKLLYPGMSNSETGSTKQLFLSDPSIANLNFFETSRVWLVKKYYHTSALRSNNYFQTFTPLSTTGDTRAAAEAGQLGTLVSAHSLGIHTQLSEVSPTLFLTSSLSPSNLLSSSVAPADSDLDLLKTSNLLFINQLTSTVYASDELFYYSPFSFTPVSTAPVAFTLRK